ncbi:MAG: hypothetical protein HQ579_01730 [Candidatus Omnitrophica bacterium]|nr:hypothetical protein [Candidatus Omnitrophota bacterium]
MIVLIAIVCTCVFAFADVTLEATGYDWVHYNRNEKELLVDVIYKHLNVDTKQYNVEKGIALLNSFLFPHNEDGTPNKARKFFLDMKCVDLIYYMISKLN